MLGSRAERRTDRGESPALKNELTREDDDAGVEDDDDVSESGLERTPRRYLACPFYKQNASRYMSCVRFQLKRARDVKQHLNRCHSRQMHCPICGVEFKDSPALENHIRLRICSEPPGGFRIQGVTAKQAKLLSRRAKVKVGEVSQWFGIWDILFPDLGHPKSPYLTNEFEEAINTVRDTWQRQGRQIVDAVLAKGAAHPTMARGTHSSDGDSHAAIHDHVMKISKYVVDELVRCIQLDSRRFMEPASCISATCKSSVPGSDAPHHGSEGQKPYPSLDAEHEQKQFVLDSWFWNVGAQVDSTEIGLVESIGSSANEVSVSTGSQDTHGVSPESNTQPETPQVPWVAEPVFGPADDALITLQDAAGGTNMDFAPGWWSWTGKRHADYPELSSEDLNLSISTTLPGYLLARSLDFASTSAFEPMIMTESLELLMSGNGLEGENTAK